LGGFEVKVLIGISSCNRFEQNGWNNAIRDTWLTDGVDYKFFHGKGSDSKPDVVVVEAGDHYEALSIKTRDKFKWSLDNGYDFLFHCYHDTYANVDRLMSSGFENYDHYGDYLHRDGYIFLQSGQGYFISRKAMEIVVDEFPTFPAKHGGNFYTSPEEDVWVGLIVAKHLDILTREENKNMPCLVNVHQHGPRKYNSIISCHLSTIAPDGYVGKYEGFRESEWKYRPEYMYKLHKEWQESCM
jgi:hypothetical protein